MSAVAGRAGLSLWIRALVNRAIKVTRVPAPVVVAEVVRSGFVEGHHYGSIVAIKADGSVDWSVGDVDSQILPRSCKKPIQAVGMLRSGLDLDG